MASKSFYVWLTLISEYKAECLVTKLVRSNWSVQNLANQMILSGQNNPAVLCALRLSRELPLKEKEPVTIAQAIDEIKDILKRIDAKYYSLIITPVIEDARWSLGNINLEEVKKEISETKKSLN